MIKIEAIVRTDKFEDVKEALSEIEVHGMTVYQVLGCGIQKGYTEVIRGHEVEMNMLPKMKFEIIIADEACELKVIKTIREAAYTGNPGDGKIISYSLNTAMRIRTGETNEEAII
ncbi:MAG: P-II family nitrogen regulator [Coprobacillus sp.]